MKTSKQANKNVNGENNKNNFVVLLHVHATIYCDDGGKWREEKTFDESIWEMYLKKIAIFRIPCGIFMICGQISKGYCSELFIQSFAFGPFGITNLKFL